VHPTGTALWEAVCEHELEGVVAKERSGRYLPGDRGWIKTKNRVTASSFEHPTRCILDIAVRSHRRGDRWRSPSTSNFPTARPPIRRRSRPSRRSEGPAT
jgi:ATP-dependent DNA ligase